MRILYIARYHSVTAERKIALLAGEPDMDVWLVRPRRWRDAYGSVDLPVRTLQRASQFTWERTARQTLRVYRDLLMVG
jgi:hypothetical protein